MTLNYELKIKLDTLKNQLNKYTPEEMRQCRDSLDTQTCRGNRCYHKLREIDAKFNVCGNVDTFLDLCGGPGQFAKYVFDVNKYKCSGYGVTLRDKLDYKFDHPNFRKMYGCFDTGNIFDANVQFELMYFCRNKCDLVLADGAFDVTGRENEQEELSLPLIQKECYIILNTLRIRGSCVLKIFDTFNDSTISVLENFVSRFSEYHVYKPPHSRAANSEKYLVCKGKLADGEFVASRKFNGRVRFFAQKQKCALEKLLSKLEKNATHQLDSGGSSSSGSVQGHS